MASTINADNGVVSGTSGLKSTADSSGVLALQTNGTTAVTVSTAQVVTLANPLPVASGGTGGSATATAGGVAYGTGTAQAYTSAGTAGQVLTSSGSGAPTWATASSGSIGTDLSYTDYTITMPTALASTAATPRMQTVALTATTEMMLYYGSSSLQAVIWNSSTSTFGTPVLVRGSVNLNAMNNVACIGISSTQVLVSSLADTTTALQTVVLSVSGSTITVNTAVSTTLASNSSLIIPNTRYIKVGSAYVLSYFQTSNGNLRFRAMTVSGTTITMGAEYAYTSTDNRNAHSYAIDSTYFLNFNFTGASLVVQAFSISGTTISIGSSNSVTCTNI
jgi:hypothetical protein